LLAQLAEGNVFAAADERIVLREMLEFVAKSEGARHGLNVGLGSCALRFEEACHEFFFGCGVAGDLSFEEGAFEAADSRDFSDAEDV
jgi:hypothetical protein